MNLSFQKLRKLLFCSVSSAIAATTFALPVRAADPEPVRFNRDIRPILASACLNCHGLGKQKGGLRLDTSEKAYEKNPKTDMTAIVPHKPDASEAIRRIFSKDDGEVMPPADSKKKLTEEQKALLKRWVLEGAAYEPHWSFAPLVKPAVPKKDAANPIDVFIDRKLAEKKIVAQPEADRATQIRRVSFAVTGLPPTLKEVDAYLADTKDGAYERMVDRYLATPQYGEEMARHWLDLARYADTHGLHLDNERSIWPYRDWVVKAFNDNKRFDTFTIEQLAGDLLPNPTQQQLVATGFNRCNISTGEGGSIGQEWLYRNAVDRATVATSTWMGLTTGCATCHDHKFDPISLKEFYAFYAFFYSLDGPPLDSNTLLPAPSIKLPTPAQETQLNEYAEKLRTLDQSINSTERKFVDVGLFAVLSGGLAGEKAVKPTNSFVAWLKDTEAAAQAKHPKEILDLLNAIKKSGKAPNPNQTRQLHDYYLRKVCEQTKTVLDPLVTEKEKITAERDKLNNSIPGTMIFRDMAKPRETFVMLRGMYDKPGEKVEPDTPKAFPAMKNKGRATRLDLAKWFVSKENPLTARVYVNRLWQQFFGVGIVKSSDDFGTQGELPSHPELLDWLAAEFQDGGWDIRATVRLILTSQAFRRSSAFTSALLQEDPENRLLARGPRYRLDAEEIRDNALFVSGLLDEKLGGKGVKPYQPSNIWEPVGYTDSNTRFYKRDSGSALYRRTIYTFYKRTAPPPYLVNFDSPSREQLCSRRDRSNTPLQSLQLLNDTQHVEASRVFAERIIGEGGSSIPDRITFAFRTVLSRKPNEKELAILTDEWKKHYEKFTKNPEDAAKLLKIGETKVKAGLKPEELAAYTLIASTILNLDETINQN
ncbi:MAG: PSD1 and planctomycete cytochrome C domain-containing protein [Gemmataceae bacterium]